MLTDLQIIWVKPVIDIVEITNPINPTIMKPNGKINPKFEFDDPRGIISHRLKQDIQFVYIKSECIIL